MRDADVHTFLVGTVLYITGAGLYQLFIEELDFPRWLKIDSTEELFKPRRSGDPLQYVLTRPRIPPPSIDRTR